MKDVNLQIRDKEFVVFVGPSGCGKTTTLRMIAGLEAITAGDIRIGDTVVNDLAADGPRHRHGVPELRALSAHERVDNMAFGLKMRKFDKAEIEKRVKSAADILGIGELLQRKPRQLSGGQRQRVALGRAIVRHPSVFLFDEPLSNLDAKLRVQMRVELKKLHERLGTTAIYVTHDQVEAMTLGDRVVVMKDGLVQQVGEPLELYNTPANRFVAGFIGSPAMNFADVTLADNGGQLVAEAPGLRIVLPDALAARARAKCRPARPRSASGRRTSMSPAPPTRPTIASTPRSRWSSSSARRSCSTCASAPALMVASVDPDVRVKAPRQAPARARPRAPALLRRRDRSRDLAQPRPDRSSPPSMAQAGLLHQRQDAIAEVLELRLIVLEVEDDTVQAPSRIVRKLVDDLFRRADQGMRAIAGAEALHTVLEAMRERLALHAQTREHPARRFPVPVFQNARVGGTASASVLRQMIRAEHIRPTSRSYFSSAILRTESSRSMSSGFDTNRS